MYSGYLVYRIFETKWKRKIFDEAINELDKIERLGKFETLNINILHNNALHFKKANDLLDLIM